MTSPITSLADLALYGVPPGAVLVVGIGNELMGDDGVGIEVLRRLSAMDLPDGVMLLEAATSAWDLVGLLHGARRIVAVDAMRGGQAPGSLYRMELEGALPGFGASSAHDLDFVQALRVASLIGPVPPTVIIGVEPKTTEFGQGLSLEVESVLERAIGAVLDEVP